MAKITIKDIAKEAGVSISTVSNALNNIDVLRPETKKHILEVADRLHYIPNVNGKNLRMKETKILGLFVNSLRGPYFSTLIDSMVWECEKYGYELNIFVTGGGKSTFTCILEKRVDGCVVLTGDQDEEGLKHLKELEVPTVFLDREVRSKKIASVVFDSYQDGRNAAQYLLAKGKKRIAFIDGPFNNYDSDERRRGFLEALKEEDISMKSEYILEGKFEKEVAYDSVKKLLNKGLPLPDAFFAVNDVSALGCMKALKEFGYSIPKDTMVMGVDDIELCEWYKPTLTTIKTGYERQAAVVIEKLVKMINNQEEGEIIKLHGKIIERESTKKGSEV